MELKSSFMGITGAIFTAFNRTAYGIEISVG